MVNNLENKIFLFLGINKFTIVAINSTNEFVYKGETYLEDGIPHCSMYHPC